MQINFNKDKFLDLTGYEEILKENNGKRFDIVLMNPPYDNGLGNSFLDKVIDISNKICTIQPTSFIVGKKQKVSIIKKINNYEVNIDKIDGNKSFEGVGYLNGEVGIIYINKFGDKEIIYNGKKISSEINELRHYSDDPLFIEFYNIVNKIYNKNNASAHVKLFWEMNEEQFKEYENKYIIRIPAFVKGYKLLSSELGLGLFKDLKNKVTVKGRGGNKMSFLKIGFAFNTKNEMNNCYNYLRTDFINACCYLIKTTMHTDRGELKYIPWFDFSDDHFNKSPREIDDWLFKKYNISDEIRKHIEEILPDYYGIRKNI